jgi:hypothetical protein
MAQSISYYKELITNEYVNRAAAIGITINPQAWSATNLDRCFIHAVSVCAWMLHSLFDLFKSDVNETIGAMKPHSLRWYAEMAKKFQYGFALPEDSDVYDNTGVDDEDVLQSKIVAYSAVTEQIRGLRIKVAKAGEIDLAPLTNDELDAFTAYMRRIKDAGVKLNITSQVADSLRLVLTVVYNPLVLTATGSRIDGIAAAPVKDAIRAYLKNLPFNGILSLQKLIDEIQKVDGVADLHVNSARARYGLLPFSNINIKYKPDSGYLRISDDDLLINYVADNDE